MDLTVLLLHAFPVGPEMWEPQIEALSAYEVLVPALAGRGDSIESWADQLLGETEGELVVVGARWAATAPWPWPVGRQRVRGLVLAGSKASADPPEARGWRDQSIALRARAGQLALWETMRGYALGPNADPAIVARSNEIVAAQDVEGLVQEVTAMIARRDTTDVVRSLSCPFLAVAGELDEGVVAECRELVGLAPEGELVVVPGAGHLVSFERPEAFNPELLRFLERCAR